MPVTLPATGHLTAKRRKVKYENKTKKVIQDFFVRKKVTGYVMFFFLFYVQRLCENRTLW